MKLLRKLLGRGNDDEYATIDKMLKNYETLNRVADKTDRLKDSTEVFNNRARGLADGEIDFNRTLYQILSGCSALLSILLFPPTLGASSTGFLASGYWAFKAYRLPRRDDYDGLL